MIYQSLAAFSPFEILLVCVPCSFVNQHINFLKLFYVASPLTCLKDNPRKGEKLTLSPSGLLAAITDSLGHVLLLDTQALVVRLWKIWKMRTGPRVLTVQCPKGGRILQPAYRFGSL